MHKVYILVNEGLKNKHEVKIQKSKANSSITNVIIKLLLKIVNFFYSGISFGNDTFGELPFNIFVFLSLKNSYHKIG